ncbi:hypothetical protein BDV34DRAFT_189175 [Aspergillus parasiticus]|uniref:Uncharacterized protein n=1 Tax=Aspergillus parasiticus TaxID=5067 RepID=A0A5N6DW71_ASPPA|nr:hypothetical protein BDV34DRAFT_189175 [Aspergillus parasiticus]
MRCQNIQFIGDNNFRLVLELIWINSIASLGAYLVGPLSLLLNCGDPERSLATNSVKGIGI